MSQYYPQQPNPPFPLPPEQDPEDYYYEEADFEYEEDDEFESSGDTLAQRGLFFCAGGCLVFLCMSCCILAGVGLWILDPTSGVMGTPVPGSDIGLAFEEPAMPFDTVANEQNIRLSLREVNRNASLPTVTPTEGQELIVITVELVNQGEEEINFSERDFMVLDRFESRYEPLPGVVDGALGRGVLPPETGLEGRLVFQVPTGEPDLVLSWNGGPDVEPRYIYLE